MKITSIVVKDIIRKLLKNEAYGTEVNNLLNAEFMEYAIDFFKKVAVAKLNNQAITTDWYKKEMLNISLSSKELAINSGTNEKTIANNFNSGRREIIVDASNEHYEKLSKLIGELVKSNNEINLTLTIKLNGVAIDLDINESLIVISSLAAKRDALNGGLWSSVGKKVEKPLMVTLCKIFLVADDSYAKKIKSKSKKTRDVINVDLDTDFEREIDFYLLENANQYKCEVKLVSKGNPENIDSFIARGSHLLVANKLSDTNKKQLNSRGCEWVELRSEDGYKRFTKVLNNLHIPFTNFTGNAEDLEIRLDEILDEILG
jgi:hypothetical protein